jgi:hypothetical protein
LNIPMLPAINKNASQPRFGGVYVIGVPATGGELSGPGGLKEMTKDPLRFLPFICASLHLNPDTGFGETDAYVRQVMVDRKNGSLIVVQKAKDLDRNDTSARDQFVKERELPLAENLRGLLRRTSEDPDKCLFYDDDPFCAELKTSKSHAFCMAEYGGAGLKNGQGTIQQVHNPFGCKYGELLPLKQSKLLALASSGQSSGA